MLAGLEVPPAVEAERVITAVLADLCSDDRRGFVIDSSPGADKRILVVRAAVELAAGEPLIVIAQTTKQVDDLIDRLARKAPELRVGRLSAAEYKLSKRVKDHEAVRVGAKAVGLSATAVIIGTVVNWATIIECPRPWATVDEAYQKRSDALVRVAGKFEQALFVGGHAQLDPFYTADAALRMGLSWDPMQSVVAVHRLPVTWWSTQDLVDS